MTVDSEPQSAGELPSEESERLARSEELHGAVRELAGRDPSLDHSARFDELALQIARFQADSIPGYGRLVEARASSLDQVATLPGVPADAFRLARVAVFGPAQDEIVFHTSGTTGAATGKHPLRTTETYREVALRGGQGPLLAGGGSKLIVALAPPPRAAPHSSLGFMMRLFMDRWDGRSLSIEPRGAPYHVESTGRWLAGTAGVDVEGLRRAARIALERHEPLLVLATSFALVALLDALSGAAIRTPRRTIVMQTGGFKGRVAEVEPERLRRQVARAFKIPETQVVSEYGMTELSSQLYEVVESDTEASLTPSGQRLYREPHWLRVVPVDPSTLRPVEEGAPGIAKFIDLANVDSAVAVVTQDLVCRRPGGIELLGRRKGARARGCSLALESLVRAAVPGDSRGAR